MATRIVIEDLCKHGEIGFHLLSKEEWEEIPPKVRHCPGGSRRVLDPGSYVLIEKVDGEWPKWALLRLVRAIPQSRNMSPILDALAGGES